jgi:cytochrome c oxidase cbb3-type subunit III
VRTIALLLIAASAFAQTARAPRDAASLEAGRALYMGSCSGCHGPLGEGSQGPSLLSGRAARLTDQALFSAIKNGLPGTSMPDFPLPEEKVWQIAGFVRSLTAPASSVSVAGNAARGRELFFGAAGCANCHMIQDRGGHPGPDLSNAGAERTLHQLRESVTKPSARVEPGFRSAKATLLAGGVIEGVARNYNNYWVQIVDKQGKLHVLRRDRLASFVVDTQSMMPPVKDPADARDLIAFLAAQTVRAQEGAGR